MTTERKRKSSGPNLSSIIGWVIFVLVIAGRPILQALQGAVPGVVQLAGYLPYVIGGLVVLSFAVSAVRAMGGARRPDRAGPSSAPPGYGEMPLPPTYGEMPVPPSLPQPSLPPAAGAPQTPRFDPVVSPTLVLAGVVGLLLLSGVAVILAGMGLL